MRYFNFFIAALNWATCIVQFMVGYPTAWVWLIPSVMWTITALLVWHWTREAY